MRKSRGVEKREWVTALRAVVLGTVGGSLAVFFAAGRFCVCVRHDEKDSAGSSSDHYPFPLRSWCIAEWLPDSSYCGKTWIASWSLFGPSVVSSFCCCRDLHLHCCLLAGNNNANVGHDPCRGAGGIWRHPKEMIEK